MKILTKATVSVLSNPTFYEHSEYKVPWDIGDTQPERLITHAGKGCYDSYGLDGRSVTNHIKGLRAAKHESVLEHANFSIFIEGISRGCSHELVRHRHFSYSQRSTRYTDEGDAAIVLDPYYAAVYENMQNGSKVDNVYYDLTTRDLVRHFINSCETSIREYAQEVETLIRLNPYKKTGTELRKWARGKARQLLPHALETRMTMTGNIRSWNEFFVKRISPHAESEIHDLACTIHEVLSPLAPHAFISLEELDTYHNGGKDGN